jgi:hypothetical protein
MTNTRTHRITTDDANGILMQHALFTGQPGGILIIDQPEGLTAHYTSNPGNMAGRMVLIDTLTPIEPKALRTPANLAAAINAAMDDAEDGTDDRDQTSAESGPYWNQQAALAVQEARQAIEAETDAKLAANGFDPMGNKLTTIEAAHVAALEEEAENQEILKYCADTATYRAPVAANREEADRTRTPAYESPRVYVDNPRTYETTTLALELANLEPLYTAARRAIKRHRSMMDDATTASDDDDALKEYVENILEDQDTRNPRTALLVALANAATCRVDWGDVAAQISEGL